MPDHFGTLCIKGLNSTLFNYYDIIIAAYKKSLIIGILNILNAVTLWRGKSESNSLSPQFWGAPLGIRFKKLILSCLLSQDGTQFLHCVKSVRIRSFFWSVFLCIQTEYGEIRSPNAGKYGPEKSPCLDNFHAVLVILRTIDSFYLCILLRFLILYIDFSCDQDSM